ncbi:LINE-1 reverse transcriptase [Elysia marginata]|uniref:LINE-1 reverse transcriptase n=1 Tax=Elysia marginata TaxID=1093978 RepID=A0AAV4I5H0_9GAST|nr:LINE-1 reverse transcriptase [Elysia marginata]
MTRIRSKIRPEIAESQFGFVPDRGTRHAVFTLSGLMEGAVEGDVYLCFIDYSKAFDKVKHSKLFGILDQLKIYGKGLRILRSLYWDQVAAIRIDGKYTDFTEIKRGMRQGCVLSPNLFNL